MTTLADREESTISMEPLLVGEYSRWRATLHDKALELVAASATSSVLLLMLEDSLIFSFIASVMASRRTPIAASFSTPSLSLKKAIVGISGMLTVGRIH